MRGRFSGLTVTVAIAAGAVSAAISVPATRSSAQVIPSPAQTAGVSGSSAENALGRTGPSRHLDGRIRYGPAAPSEVCESGILHAAQREELDKERSALYGEERPAERGTEFDVAARIITRYSCPISTSARVRRWLSTRPMAAFRG